MLLVAKLFPQGEFKEDCHSPHWPLTGTLGSLGTGTPKGASERELREARRLFYVRFTRAEEEVHVLFSARNPSPFVTELDERLEDEWRDGE